MSRCQKGKSCGATCIEKVKLCRVGLPKVSKTLDRARDNINTSTAPKGAASGTKEEGKSAISEESRKAAKETIAKYAETEPATTALMERLAKENNSKLVDLDFRLKTEDSLARKIEGEKHEYGGDARRTAASMSDINRYTMQIPQGKYGDNVKNVIDELQSQGFQVRIKNYWSEDAGPYRGMNVALTHPDGRKIELQFHTAASLRIKNKIHGDYEEYRVSRDNDRRRVLWDRMVRFSRTIPMPKGALSIGSPEDVKKIEFRPV